MTLTTFAEDELRRAGLLDADSDYGGMLGRSVLEMVEKFSEQGHSGFSAAYAMSVLERLLRFQPLSPLTGEDDEWNDVSDVGGRDGGPLFQNKRYSSVFKDDGVAYDINAVVIRDPRGGTWSARQRDPIDFPYMPSVQPRIIDIDQHGRTLDPDESRYNTEGFCDDDGCRCWYGGPMLPLGTEDR